MPLITVDGIVVRNADYKENDRMLTVFTREYGALGVSVRGCRRKGSTMLACSEPV
ncbi:MAG: recombination protein O N-terminal domain-containing protein, partial [Clostridia bacterium]|nr:recombination protein O N-terminal domain-containing protein [Clostridia bacterium]